MAYCAATAFSFFPTRLLACLGLLLAAGAAQAEEAPYGIEQRVPWTTSKLVGSPEPPLPYAVRKAFEHLEFKAPLYALQAPDGGPLLVVLAGGEEDRPSKVVALKNDPAATETWDFFELPRRLIYSICFHPQFATNRQVFVFSNGPWNTGDRHDRVTRYTVSPEFRIEPESEKLILEWKSGGHDGGDMAFDAAGLMYISAGDGSTDSDTLNSGQTIDDLLGSILRIDVDHPDGDRPYSIPQDNPFLHLPGARPELWAIGLRNPWRMSLDRVTGQLWVGVNGQDLWETAHLVRPGDNYGWSVFEGSHPFYLERQFAPAPHTPPTIEHHHADFRSLTGGVVYHGAKFPDLEGAYIYGDYSSGRIWGMKHDGERAEWHRELADTALQIAGFCLTNDGELLIVDHGGGIYRLEDAPRDEPPHAFPRLLSETGLFTSTAAHEVAPGLIPYSVNAPAWTDGATAERFVALPGEAQIDFSESQSFSFPDGTALVQTLTLERTPGDANSRFRIETRVLLRQQGEWAGYSYRWNAEQTDAELAPKSGEEIALTWQDSNGALHEQPWQIPSRMECLACHSRAANLVLGVSWPQLHRQHAYAGGTDQQMRVWKHLNLFKNPPESGEAPAKDLVDPYHASADLETRVRSYLHVNCAACHMEAGGGNSKMELGFNRERERMNVIGARPQHATLGVDNAMIVFPGDPERSVLWQRLSRRGPGQMPPLVSRTRDEGAIALFREWIAQLPPERPVVKQWTMNDFATALAGPLGERAIEAGAKHFSTAGCIQCHRKGNDGGVVGPNLTGISRRLQAAALLESILLPSKTIAEGYAGVVIETDDGRVITGRIEREDAENVTIRPASALEPSQVIPVGKIVAREPLKTSNMPSGTVDVLHEHEILDLLAYLLSEPEAGE